MSDVSRRGFMQAASAAAAAMGTVSARAGVAVAPAAGKIKVISSGNGAEATRKAYEMIAAGSDPLDAVVVVKPTCRIFVRSLALN